MTWMSPRSIEESIRSRRTGNARSEAAVPECVTTARTDVPVTSGVRSTVHSIKLGRSVDALPQYVQPIITVVLDYQLQLSDL
jgi:hypothetical protein